MLEIVYALLAGLLTVGAPCILPILPIILGSNLGQPSKLRPAFITLGFVLTFTVLGLVLSTLVTRLMLAPDTLRNVAVVLLGIFGILMIWPTPFEKLTGYLSEFLTRAQQTGRAAGTGNFGGFILGILLGVIWTPCAGPVLGSILTLIATQSELQRASVLMLAYAIGAGVPLLVIGYATQWATTRISTLAKYTRILQQIFGLLIITLAVLMYFELDLRLQEKLLEYYPESYFKY